MDELLESFLAVSDSGSIDASFNRLIESRSTDSDQNDLIQRALHVASVLLESGKKSARKRSSIHNAFVWPLPHDLTIKVFSMLDTQSVCYVAATCSFFQKCAMDPLCFANIDLTTSVYEINDTVVSTVIQRAGNALKSIKLGVLPPSTTALFCLPQPLVYSIRYSASAFSWKKMRSKQGKESSILTRSCLSSLSGNGGLPGSYLRRLYLYNIEKMDKTALLASLSVCPSLIDLEIMCLHIELRHILQSVSKHCPLIKRLIVESSKRGGDYGLKYSIFNEFVLNCPNITTLALKGFKLPDSKAHILLKGLTKLQYVDFSTSYSITGSFLRNLCTNCDGIHLEVIILRDCMQLKKVEVEQFMAALLAGEFRLLRHLDISNTNGLASDDDWQFWHHRLFSTSFIPKNQLLEQRPNFCLVAEFSDSSLFEVEEAMISEYSSSDGSLSRSTSSSNYSSEDSEDSSSVNSEESSD